MYIDNKQIIHIYRKINHSSKVVLFSSAVEARRLSGSQNVRIQSSGAGGSTIVCVCVCVCLSVCVLLYV
jgi:hypothetical protein